MELNDAIDIMCNSNLEELDRDSPILANACVTVVNILHSPKGVITLYNLLQSRSATKRFIDVFIFWSNNDYNDDTIFANIDTTFIDKFIPFIGPYIYDFIRHGCKISFTNKEILIAMIDMEHEIIWYSMIKDEIADEARECIDAFRKLCNNGLDLTIFGVSDGNTRWLMDDDQCYNRFDYQTVFDAIEEDIINCTMYSHGKRARNII